MRRESFGMACRSRRLRASFLASAMGVASRPTRSNSRRAASHADRFLPTQLISSSTVGKKVGRTSPLYPHERIDGQMYDDLQTAGVLPSCAAVSFTAAVSNLRR